MVDASGSRGKEDARLKQRAQPLLTAAVVFAHPECEAAYERARVLCETAGDARQLGLALGSAIMRAYRRVTSRATSLSRPFTRASVARACRPLSSAQRERAAAPPRRSPR